jgi:hypothetical protein
MYEATLINSHLYDPKKGIPLHFFLKFFKIAKIIDMGQYFTIFGLCFYKKKIS